MKKQSLIIKLTLSYLLVALLLVAAVSIFPMCLCKNSLRDKIGQALSNLLFNSVRHTPHGGHITITISQSGDNVRMMFEDDGEGIDQEHLPHIFERFYRADSSRSKLIGEKVRVPG